MNKALLLAVIIFIVKISFGQNTTMFNDTILPFGSGAYTIEGICQDDSFYYMLGGVNNYQPKWNLMVLKMDKNGVLIDKKKFEDSLLYYAAYPYNSIELNNNSIIYCTTITDTAQKVNGMIMCLNKHSLDTLWTKIYLHPDTSSILSISDNKSVLTAIKATPDNCYILTGNYRAVGSLYSYLMKIDSVGNTLWTKTYSMYYSFYNIQLAPDSGYYIPCTYNNTVLNLIKVDKNGEFKWNVSINSNSNPSYPMAISLSNNGNISISSSYWYDLTNNLRGITISNINPTTKTLVWEKNYILYQNFIGMTLHQAMGLEILSDGSIVVSGTLAKTSADLKGFIFKLNSNGDSLWTKTYDFGNPIYDDCQLNDVIVCDDGGFMGVGFFWSHLVSVNDAAWMFKTDANGVVGWEASTPLSVQKLNVWPNPASDYTKINIGQALNETSEIIIYNSLGQIVETLSFQKQQREIVVNLQGFKAGVYYFELRTNNKIIGTGKFIKE